MKKRYRITTKPFNILLMPITTTTQSLAKLTDYFNFFTSSDIRLKGTRIGIETILYEYIDRGRTPEEIAENML